MDGKRKIDNFGLMGVLNFGGFILCAAKNLAHKTHSGQQKPHLTVLQVNPFLKSFSFYLVHNLSMLVSVLFGCFCQMADHFAQKKKSIEFS